MTRKVFVVFLHQGYYISIITRNKIDVNYRIIIK